MLHTSIAGVPTCQDVGWGWKSCRLTFVNNPISAFADPVQLFIV